MKKMVFGLFLALFSTGLQAIMSQEQSAAFRCVNEGRGTYEQCMQNPYRNLQINSSESGSFDGPLKLQRPTTRTPGMPTAPGNVLNQQPGQVIYY